MKAFKITLKKKSAAGVKSATRTYFVEAVCAQTAVVKVLTMEHGERANGFPMEDGEDVIGLLVGIDSGECYYITNITEIADEFEGMRKETEAIHE